MKSSRPARKTTARTKHQPCDVLILTGSVGSGHISVARAISEALHRTDGARLRVETVDFMKAFANPVTKATKTIYLGSLKISPKIYELIFARSSMWDWPVKLLNAISAPFMQKKFLGLMEEKKPSVLVSTYPVWDILIKKTWDKWCGSKHRKLPFVSVVTDSISIHRAWMKGEPDFFIVPNSDTKIALQNFGVPAKRIKDFGFPIAHRFTNHTDEADFRRTLGLSPRRITLLLILSLGIHASKIKKLMAAIHASSLKGMQLVIIAGSDEKLRRKLASTKWPWPTRVTGWTNEMHTFIHGSDIVLTKAGGATIMECIHSAKPMVVIDAIPGHEMGNAMLVQKYNLGAMLNEEMSNFDSTIEYLLTYKTLIRKNLSRQQKPHAAEDIAKFLTQLVKS